ncbi:MAG: bifunctional 5,10-methylenetetrahydrofolate dehydrogenase/5,10-methenyltetrahydrofolate cyclohydrolase [Oscillospiraceae bacterium]|nr:bifunctional 5,10-methylenetetrahydrofolate dehydrogenase/5,10-methenyltetrahydrofolate cyclohydrolase [Oscillospiraceae bacterium]
MDKELKGIEVVRRITKELKVEVEQLKNDNIQPTLAIVRVGNKEDDIYYQQSAVKRCTGIGIAVEEHIYDESITEQELINEIVNLNLDEAVNGVLILRPLPKHITDSLVCAALDPAKDIDGITDGSLAGVMKNDNTGFAPCTARACIEILKHFEIDPSGQNVVVIGRSLVVGKPLALMLISLNATITVCHTRTKDLEAVASAADILIAAAGRAKMVGREFVKPSAIVIDVGINADEDGKMVGDVDFDDVVDVVSHITPVPGGVGTVTTAVLAMHVLEATKKQLGL